MARTSRRAQAPPLLLLLLLAPLVSTQTLTDLPNLSTATQLSSKKPNAKTSSGSATFATTGSTPAPFHLTGLPTIAGAGIPTLVVPYTADAPYMRKSSLPEGTFFIAVGATLAFLGACVLLWRAMVAWSIDRSVKRSAMASVGGRSEKNGSTYGGWSGSRKSSGYNPISKVRAYKTSPGGNSVSMENLTSAGKPMGKPQFRDSIVERSSSTPQDLFFSPTAQARENTASTHRSSGYMPSGFYASANSQPAGGAPNTTIGASLSPYAQQQHKRSSTQGTQMISPPLSPEQHSRGSTTLYNVSRDGAPNKRDSGLRGYSRDGQNNVRNSNLYAQPSSSSLMVGQSSNGSESGPPSRVPSAYLEDLFDNHGNGPRERF